MSATRSLRRSADRLSGVAKIALMSVLLCAAPSPLVPHARGADTAGLELRFAFQNAVDHPQGLGARHFAALVQQRSDARISVRLFAGGKLGGDLKIVAALQDGSIDLSVLNSGLLAAQAKDMAIFDLPFMFETAREVDAVVDGEVGKRLARQLEAFGLVSLGYWDLGFRQLTNSKRAVVRLEDLAGLRIRVIQSQIFLDTFKALGAEPVPMAFPDVYASLKSKVIDGQENPYTTIRASRFNEVQRYLSATRHVYSPQSFVISKRTWDRLSPSDRKLIVDAAAEASRYQRALSRERQDEELKALKLTMMFSDIAPGELQRFRERVRPVIEKHAKRIAPEVMRALQEELTRMRAMRPRD